MAMIANLMVAMIVLFVPAPTYPLAHPPYEPCGCPIEFNPLASIDLTQIVDLRPHPDQP